ncbi:glycosyltransferase [Blautia schinkii]|nr:glycosyltransferase [Blautia schinkii]
MTKKAKIEKRNVKSKKETFWVIIAVISMIIYIGWRIFFTLPKREIYGWLAAICGIILVISESVSMLEGAEHFFRLRRKVIPEKPVVPLEWYPHVDVFITTHNEEKELIYKTVNGCLHMDYPDKHKVHIYICDDGNRPEMAQLASEMKVGYCTMEENKYAKAGNLNNALEKTSSPWIVTFDADMIPTHDFLMETVPYIFLPQVKKLEDGTWIKRTEEEIDEKYKIGYIQTPQSFYNPDLFQFNFYSEGRIPNEQDFFFREINVGRNGANAALYAGSNTLISREALNEVGGIATGTITEDFETGIRIQAEGYTCYALDIPLAHGLAPTDIDSLIKQRIRWGRGCVYSLRRIHIILNPKLKLNTKLSYISCLLYWWTFFRRFVYIAAPILFVLFGIPVVICNLTELLFIWLPSYVLYNHALKVTSGKIRTQRWSNIVDTTIFPYMIIPILLESLFIKQKKFNVTSKTRTAGKNSDWQLAIPHILLLAFDLAALFISVRDALLMNNFGSVIIIFWLAVNGLNLIMSLFFMSGRKNMRVNDRFLLKIPVEIMYRGKKYEGNTRDASETGLSIWMEKSIYMPHEDDAMEIHLKTERYEATLKGKSVQVSKKDGKWLYGVQITDFEGQDKSSYYQMLYDHHHSLANQMGKSVSVFEDVYLNTHKRIQKGNVSRRKLPRVDINCDLESLEGNKVHIVDCNYEYISLNPLSGANLPDCMSLKVPGCDELMKLKATGTKAGLYYIQNWKELLNGNLYEELFFIAKKEAEEKAAAQIQTR